MDKTGSIEGNSHKKPELEDNYDDQRPAEFVLQDAKGITGNNDKQSVTTDLDDSSSRSSVQDRQDDEEPAVNCNLPDLVIKEILKKIQDQQTLLTCRLVCVKWNQFIKDSQLMTRIKFPIWHAKPFLDLPIVKKGKVTSISLKNCSLLEHKRKFIDLVSNSIENVEFDFEDETLSAERARSHIIPLFRLVFEYCPKLQEMTWKKGPLKLLQCLPLCIPLGSANQIRVATIFTKFTALNSTDEDDDEDEDEVADEDKDVSSLMDFLSKLPKLKRLKLVMCYRVVNAGILSGLQKFIEKCAAADNFNLKELTLHGTEMYLEHTVEAHQVFFQFLLLCDQHKIELLEELPFINCNYLLSSTNPTPKLSRSPTFQAKVNGYLTFEGPKLTNLDRLNGLNFGKLTLHFKRDVMNGELSWIKDLDFIESLVLGDYFEPRSKIFGQSAIAEFEAVFSSSIPTLKKLDIVSNGFSSIVFHWAEYFPNLTELSMHSCGNSPENLIVELTALEFLTSLKIWIPYLCDAAFTAECVNRFAETGDGNWSMAPAITCFKSLKFLDLYVCPGHGLTDACFINRICKSKTLEKLVTINCKKMARKCKKLCQFEVKYYETDSEADSGSDSNG